jgi:hypothetical protein
MKLDLSYKNLKSLSGIEINDDVTELCCNGNQITSLVGVNFPPNLKKLYCNFNQITSFVGVNFPPNLEVLCCNGNQITSLVGVNFPQNLKILNCYGNQITSLVGVNFPQNLEELYCSGNQITEITNPPLGLKVLFYDKSKVKYIDDVKMSDIKFSLLGYQAICRIQIRMKRRYKIKNDASRIIGRRALEWLHTAPNGDMFKHR